MDMDEINLQTTPKTSKKELSPWIWGSILIGIFLIGAYFRFVGLNWDDSQHLHPDERFLTMVESALMPVKSLDQFFNTAQSTLNPHNVGYTFFVYGTLPIFMVRYAAEWLSMTGYGEVFLLGRAFSGMMDLLTILFVFLIAQRAFNKRGLSLLAAGLYACAVLPIQLSHFFAVDTFTNAFSLLAVYFAVVIMTEIPRPAGSAAENLGARAIFSQDWGAVKPFLLFGLAYGMAMASKVSILPLAAVLPFGALIYWSRLSAAERMRTWPLILRNLFLAGLVAFLVFRVGQPYAFKGPGFFGLLPNQAWVENLTSLAQQSSGAVDMPPALQWVSRPLTFAWQNLVEWGLGLPLGLLALAGMLWMGVQIVKGRWREYSLIWLWTAGYSLWQGLSWVRAMRYQVPAYPLLALVAAWLVVELWEQLPAWLERRSALSKKEPHPRPLPENGEGSQDSRGNLTPLRRQIPAWTPVMGRVLAGVIGVGVVVCSAGWAYAFTRIYTRPMTRVAATEWIYQNVPGPVNLHIQTADGSLSTPLSYSANLLLDPDRYVITTFTAQSDGGLSEVALAKLSLLGSTSGVTQLSVEVSDAEAGSKLLSSGSKLVSGDLQGKGVSISLEKLVELKKGHRYSLRLSIAGSNPAASLDGEILLKVAGRYSQVNLNVKDSEIKGGLTYSQRFVPETLGSINQVTLPVVSPGMLGRTNFTVVLIAAGGGQVAAGNLMVDWGTIKGSPVVSFEPPLRLEAGKEYLITVDAPNTTVPVRLNGTLSLKLVDDLRDQALPAPTPLIQPGAPFTTAFSPQASGLLTEVSLAWVAQQDPNVSGADTLTVSILDSRSGMTVAESRQTLDLTPRQDARGTPVRLQFSQPLRVEKGGSYLLQLAPSQGAISLRGSAPANETTWDDALPLRMDNLDGYGGIYARGLNFEMYWEDNADKLARFTQTLNQADYVFMSSNRQWGTTTRVEDRYPLTTAYYRGLMGCPPEKTVGWCYSVAQPGMFESEFGFKLVKVFQSNPNLGTWEFNDQFAEEAFTVYDHPKVLIFQKTGEYAPEKVQNILGAVDLSKAVTYAPIKAGIPANLMLPSDRLAQQQAGGTWSELFPPESLLNRVPALGLLVWYLFILTLGWMMYPMVRLALGGLADRGYPLARLVGLLVLAYCVWLLGSYGPNYTAGTIWLVLGGLLLVNLALFAAQRDDLLRELKQRNKYILLVEGLFLLFFLIDLGIRLGNPDLWHPYKGGEKPMDFSYLNAVLKSSSFPPYDPWFEGGYINYYYYGFVLVGTPIKALGITPAVAYNFVLPTLFALTAMGAFSVGWNLLNRVKLKAGDGDEEAPSGWAVVEKGPLLAGCAAAVGLVILGNLGTINMIWEGFQLLVVPRETMDQGDLLTRLTWMFQGVGRYFAGNPLPYNIGEWYWNPSRAIPYSAGNPITEFPFFTFLYADLHAHMIALPLTVLSLAWGLGILRGRWQWGEGRGEGWAWLQFGLTFGLGGLVLGALWPTNTWDMPAYLSLSCLAVVYTALRYGSAPQRVLNLLGRLKGFFAEMSPLPDVGDEGEIEEEPAESRGLRWAVKIACVVLPAVVLLAGLVFALYLPFSAWNGRNNALDIWKGELTPEWAYRMHWGVFLFVIISWLVAETLDWMAKTPVSALNRLRARWGWVAVGAAGVLMVMFYLALRGIEVGWSVVLLGGWAVLLMFRPGQSDAKRMVLFLFGSALALTLLVEIVVLRDDIERMNTVFKFYLQAWTLFAVSAGAALAWVIPAIWRWNSSWSSTWQAVGLGLVFSALMFTVLGGQAKVDDRMAGMAPHTLDGMAYMDYSSYGDMNTNMTLDEDARAIRWLLQHVIGSPVIVEANTPEYRWGSRFTIYTGLPGVVGWNWHQRQQRALVTSDWVTNRVDEIGQFYQSRSESAMLAFLRRYSVRYIIIGQLEQAYYPGVVARFAQYNGKDWQEVYRDGKTTIYEVLQ